jgi:SAM-dependent methyltransferase
MSVIHRLINRLSPRLGNAVAVAEILLGKRGYWRSLREQRPVGADGTAIPWITYPALDHLARLDFSQAAVLEYGAGYSSLWWAARARTVVAVESRAKWVEDVRRRAPPNLTVIATDEDAGAYVKAPLQPGASFDVIIIDGVHRQQCAQASLPFLRPGGIVVLDNSDWHPHIGAWLREQGMLQFDFHGFGPLNPYTWCTSLFVRGTSCLPYADAQWSAARYGNLEQVIKS